MSEFDDVIRAAREGLEPAPTDRERVWRRLAIRAGIAGAAVTLITKTSAGATASGGATVGPVGMLAGQSLATLAKVVFGSMALTLAGASAVVAVTRPEATGPGQAPATRPVPDKAAARGVDSERAFPQGAGVVQAPSARARPDPAPQVLSGRRGEPVAADSAAGPAASAEPARAGLSAELSLLVEVRRASALGEHNRAQRLLNRLDEEHPRGALIEERAALRAAAACQAGDPGRAEHAREFLRRYPESVYAAKVQRVCGDPGTLGDAAKPTKSFTDLDGSGH